MSFIGNLYAAAMMFTKPRSVEPHVSQNLGITTKHLNGAIHEISWRF